MNDITINAPSSQLADSDDAVCKICGGTKPSCCSCPPPKASEGVSEAAPERIWIWRRDADSPWQVVGLHTEHDIEYARVDQLPELNLEDRKLGEMQTKASSLSSVVIPESVSLDAAPQMIFEFCPSCAGELDTGFECLRCKRDWRPWATVYFDLKEVEQSQ